MNEAEFRKEKLYLSSLNVFRGMQKCGLITDAEFEKASELLLKKYKPILSTLLQDVS